MKDKAKQEQEQNQNDMLKSIVNYAKVVRKLVLGEKLNKRFGYPHNYNWIDSLKSTAGVRILYTDSDVFDSIIRWNPNLHIPEIIVSRFLSFDRRIYCIARSLGCLLLCWNWTPHEDLPKSALKFAKKQDNVLDIYPGCEHYMSKYLPEALGLFAVVFVGLE